MAEFLSVEIAAWASRRTTMFIKAKSTFEVSIINSSDHILLFFGGFQLEIKAYTYCTVQGVPKKTLVFEFQISHILLNSSEKLYEFNGI